jgi:ATP-dependent Clp protease adapter protein ClpS
LHKNRQKITTKKSDPNLKSALSALLAFVLHSKPKVRKAAQKAVTLLVHTNGISVTAVEEVATFATGELQRATKDQHTLQLLTFLRSVIFIFPLAKQKEICQTCLRLQTLGSQMVRIQALRKMILQ